MRTTRNDFVHRYERTETFSVEGDYLVRKVDPQHGQHYEHRCPRLSFEQIAHAIEEIGGHGFTLESLVKLEDTPFTQVAVALAFLKERGIVGTKYKRNYSATHSIHLDAMTEFHALAENG